MQNVTPYLLYEEVDHALDWLTRAFGFEEVLRYTGEEGYVNHAEMRTPGGGQIYLGDPGEQYRNPKELGNETVGIHVVVDEVDELCERARKAGAVIKDGPSDQAYGERRFIAVDPEGHYWFFAKPTKEVAPEEWGAQVAAR
jgi:uncharacterized glyoxalase superfamily protein PhnB